MKPELTLVHTASPEVPMTAGTGVGPEQAEMPFAVVEGQPVT